MRSLFGKRKRKSGFGSVVHRVELYPYEFAVFESRNRLGAIRQNIGVYGLRKRTKTVALKDHLALPKAVYESFNELSKCQAVPEELRNMFRVRYIEWQTFVDWLNGRHEQDIPSITPERKQAGNAR